MKALKKLTGFMTAIVCAVSGLAVGGYAGAVEYGEKMQYGDYLYYTPVDEDEDGTYDYAEISGCDESVTEVEIPAEIDGLSVKSIGHAAFCWCESLTSITIPNSVTSIGDGAFYECSELKSITIPNSVTSIGYCAFYSCSSLESITIPNGVTSIGHGAFSQTPWLDFKREENPLVIINGILIDGQTCSGDVTVPDGVTSIGDEAFLGCYSLTGISIPDSVTSIGESAFSWCESLTSITIPKSVVSIGNYAFSNCSKLTSITIENPECEIYDSEDTINNGHDEDYNLYFAGTIYGYENSTAQEYAERYNRTFVVIGETPPEPVKGDLNGDREVTIADAVALQKYLVNLKTLSENISADMNDDGVVNAFDLIILKRQLIA